MAGRLGMLWLAAAIYCCEHHGEALHCNVTAHARKQIKCIKGDKAVVAHGSGPGFSWHRTMLVPMLDACGADHNGYLLYCNSLTVSDVTCDEDRGSTRNRLGICGLVARDDAWCTFVW